MVGINFELFSWRKIVKSSLWIINSLSQSFFFTYLKVLSFRLMHLLGFTRVGRLNALFVGCWRKMFSILTLIFRKLSSFLRSALLSRLGYILVLTAQISFKNQQILDLICNVSPCDHQKMRSLQKCRMIKINVMVLFGYKLKTQKIVIKLTSALICWSKSIGSA